MTIIDILRNAKTNLSSPLASVQRYGLGELSRAIAMLDKGYPASFDIRVFGTLYDSPEGAPTYADYLHGQIND